MPFFWLSKFGKITLSVHEVYTKNVIAKFNLKIVII